MIRSISEKPRKRSLEDNITTVLGVVSAVAAGLNQYNYYPRVTGAISVIALALLGLFTNKPLR
jgi:hypothetical protein